jgi:acetoin:2,6-dichlorophenolindophenol oxidoreductase subunit alpha
VAILTVRRPSRYMYTMPTLTRPSDEDLQRLLLIRHFELGVLDLFSKGELSGTTHTCIGQEHVPVALRPLLNDGDFIFSNHRGHGHYLARYDDPAGLLAEIMGRKGALCGGVGGSQHLMRDRFMSTGIQGQSLPIASGVALIMKRRSRGDICVVYIGDGTWGEGVVYEALNLMRLWDLPVLLIVENNGIAQSSLTRRQLAGDIADRVRAFGIPYKHIDAIDLEHIRCEVKPLLDSIRATSSPAVIEFRVDRLGPHSKGDDTRTAEELAELRKGDWYQQYSRHYPIPFGRADEEARRHVQNVIADVATRPLAGRDYIPAR